MIRPDRHQDPTERDLIALADGSLPAARRVRVERAVVASPDLQASIAAQRRALSAISDAAGEPAPVALRARLALAHAPCHRRGARRSRARGFATAAVAAAALAIVAMLAVNTGTNDGPTIADAAVLATRAPLASAPAHREGSALLLRLRADGLPYPYWEDRFGFTAVGVRTDRIAKRLATTVFYGHGAQRIAYTIVAGSPLAVNSPARTTVADAILLRSWTEHGRLIVTWLRRGHTCVLSGASTQLSSLLRLAAWKDGGKVPY